MLLFVFSFCSLRLFFFFFFFNDTATTEIYTLSLHDALPIYGLGLVTDAQTILHVAELGVVMFLFVIGLEMKPSHLWRSEEHTSELQSQPNLVCRLLLEKKKKKQTNNVVKKRMK